MELAKEARDLVGKVYEEAKTDGYPEIDLNLHIHDSYTMQLGCLEWLIELLPL